MSKKTDIIQSVKGTRDLLPGETALWQRVEEEARKVFGAYNFREIRTPIFEETRLFARSVGADTDIVTKEMYTFEDQELTDLVRQRNLIAALQWDPRSSGHLKQKVNLFIDSFQKAVALGKVPKLPRNAQTLEEIKQSLDSGSVMRPNEPAGANPSADDTRSRLHWDDITRKVSALDLGVSLTLRPEATASVVRAYIEHGLFNEGTLQKLYYVGPMFRRERPQKGRYRQFYQIGAEVLGSDHPAIDAEVLEMLVLLLTRLGLKEFKLLINSVGCSKCRPEYLKVLRKALDEVKDRLCADCQRRASTNPLRVLDCKVEADQPIIEKLPVILDYLCPECRQHFDCVTSELRQRGIAFEIVPRLVRGLDYYTRTTFEVTSTALGAQDALLGGGRYDGLSEMLGGPPAPGFGFAIGQDRLVLAVQEAGLPLAAPLAVYIAWMGDTAQEPATALARELRAQGINTEIVYQPIKLKKSLGIANKLQARYAIIIGENEVASGQYQLKDMQTGEQQSLSMEQSVAFLRDKCSGSATGAVENQKSSQATATER